MSGRSSSPEHPGERVADSSMPQHTSLAMQYVNHANVPSTGYAYTEHRLHGVTDVDVDEKPHLVYETMTDLQTARQHMGPGMNGGPPGFASNHVDGHCEKYAYAGIPNNSVKQRNSTSTCAIRLIKVIWNLFLFIVVVGAFSLSVYNFLNNNSTSTTTVVTPSAEPPSETMFIQEGTGVSSTELNNSLADLREELESQFERRYRELNNTIYAVVNSVSPVSSNNELDLTAGCVQVGAACTINHNNVGTPPASGVCETDTHAVDVPGFRNVNIFCNVDNSAGEVNPVTSTLNIFNGEVSCLCSLIALTTPTATPECRLTIQRCPDTIRLNTTNMR